MVPGEDVVCPVRDGVHGVVVLGNLSAVAEYGERLESFEGALAVFGILGVFIYATVIGNDRRQGRHDRRVSSIVVTV